MTFAEPLLLWLLVLPAAWLAFEFWRRRTSDTAHWPRIARRWAGPRGVADATRASLSGPRWRLALGLALAAVAFARPQAGYIEEKTYDPSREVLLALDLSRSMLAEDVKPNRLQRARLLIETLLDKLKGERVGLLLFSGTAFLQSPLSSDYEVLREFLPNLDPDYLPEGGTDYDQMLKVALDSYSNEAGADRYLIVLSDGESQTEAWRNRLETMKERRVRTIALGIGTATGSVMPLKDGGFVKDERGAVVMSRLEPATLQQLASATGGAYVDASEWVDLPAILSQTVERGKVTSSATRTTRRLREQFQWFLGSALLLLAWSYWIEFPVRPRSREVARRAASASPAPQPRSAAAATSASAGLALALASWLLFTGTPAGFAATYVPPPAPSPSRTPRAPQISTPPNDSVLPKIVERLAAKPELDAGDCAHLARETVSFGESELAAQRRPKPGIVHDALAAVDQGERLNPQAADWADLRAKLNQLLEEPPEQKPQQPPQQDKNKKDPQDSKDQQQQQPQQDQSKSQNQSDSQPKSDAQSEPKQDPQSQPQDKSQSDSQSNSDPSKQPQSSPPGDSSNPPEAPKDQGSDSAPPPPRQKAFDPPAEPKSGARGEPESTPPPQEQPTQTIGGERPASEELEKNPQLAVPLQKLDEARANDSPGRLFKLLQRDTQPPQKPKKDW